MLKEPKRMAAWAICVALAVRSELALTISFVRQKSLFLAAYHQEPNRYLTQ